MVYKIGYNKLYDREDCTPSEMNFSKQWRNDMTDKEVRKLKRAELLEILFYMQKEMETLRTDNENLRRQLESVSSAKGISDEDIARLAQALKTAMDGTAPEEKAGE